MFQMLSSSSKESKSSICAKLLKIVAFAMFLIVTKLQVLLNLNLILNLFGLNENAAKVSSKDVSKRLFCFLVHFEFEISVEFESICIFKVM